MWHWLWIATLSCTELLTPGSPATAWAAPPSTQAAQKQPSPLPLTPEAQGPRSAEESSLLWGDGKKAFDQARWPDAIRLLRRLTSRYPTHPQATEAHLLLGRALLQSGNASEAIVSLRHFIEARGTSPEAHQARLGLAEAYIRAQRPQEALQVLRELAPAEQARRLPPASSAERHLLAARAHLIQRHHREAEDSLREAQKHLPANLPSLLSLSEGAALEVRLARCEELPGAAAAHADEARLSGLLGQRGICLTEALVHFNNLLRIESKESQQRGDTARAGGVLIQALQSYQAVCSRPPAPVDQRSASQKRQYVKELRGLLTQTCTKALLRNLSLLDAWKNAIPQAAQPELARVRAACEAATRF